MSTAECGAAALAMIISGLGRSTTVAECRDAASVGRDGLAASDIARVARERGVDVQAYATDLDGLRRGRTPSILHWGFNHFVVLERWDGRSATIVDPAAGRRRVDADEMSRMATGVVLEFSPGATFRPRRRSRLVDSFRFVRTRIRMPLPVALGIGAASLLVQALVFAPPLVTRAVVDGVLPTGNLEPLPSLAVALVAVLVGYATATWARAIALAAVQRALDKRLQGGFFGHLMRLPFRFYALRGTGDLTMRLASNSMLRELLTGQLGAMFIDGVLVVGALAVLLVIAPLYGVAAAVLGAVQVTVLLLGARRVDRLSQSDIAAQSAAQGYATEVIGSFETIRSMGAESSALRQWTRLFDRQQEATERRSVHDAHVDAVLGGLRTATPAAFLAAGTLGVLDGSMTLGTMIAFNALGATLLAPLSTMISSTRQLFTALANVDRVRDVLEEAPEVEGDRVVGPRELHAPIVFDHVGFRFSEREPWIVQDLDFRIEPGTKVAIVGRTGAGKSTVGRLLLGLHTASTGSIRIGEHDLRAVDRGALRASWGAVLQQSDVFGTSIRENITFGTDIDDDDRILEAARAAQIHDDVMRMPLGYDTVLAESGATLSGGQRQRIALARALLRRPALLLLDEATSHLDAVTEHAVDEALSRVRCTRVVIAHRLSTVRDADLVLVLHDGRVVERGTHQELLVRGGRYAALMQTQQGGAEVDRIPA